MVPVSSIHITIGMLVTPNRASMRWARSISDGCVGCRLVDPAAGDLGAAHLQADVDELEAGGVKLLAQLPATRAGPSGSLNTAPRRQQNLLPAQR